MTRPESHEIDETAKRVLGISLPPSWVIREQNPDYRIDYTVEIFEKEESSGLFWHVQLKGVKNPKVLKSTKKISFSMEVEHLKYYMDKVPLPVFLVVVDTQNEVGWWIFLQRYIQDELKENWRQQSTTTIHVPSENVLGNSANIHEAVSDAMHYMRELNPSSIEAALNAEIRRLEELDPRFEIDINATNHKTHYLIKPKQGDIRLNLNFRGKDSIEKAKEFIEAGGNIDFEKGEVEAEFEGIVHEWLNGFELVSLQSTKKAPSLIRFLVSNESTNRTERLDISGEITGGTKRAECVCELPERLIKVSVPIDFDKFSFPINIEINDHLWVGRNVTTLPYLDLLFPFFDFIMNEELNNTSSTIRMIIFAKGNQVLESNCDEILTKIMQYHASRITAMYKVRYVAKKYGLIITVPTRITAEQFYDIDVVYNFIKHGKYSNQASNETITFSMPRNAFTEQLSEFKSHQEWSYYLKDDYPFLSSSVDLGYRKVSLSSMTIDEKNTLELDDHTVQVTLVADAGCVCTIQKCTETEIKMLQSGRN